MTVKTYSEKDGKKLYEVYLNALDVTGKRVQVRRRGFLSQREAKLHEDELKRELKSVRDGTGPVNWCDWCDGCFKKMAVELRSSTLENYQGTLTKWAHPVWKDRDLKSITSMDVHELVHETIQDVSPNTRRSILKMVKRMFQAAVEDGVLDRNPALKVKVKVPEPTQAVLNATEADAFLREAKATRHRFYEIWAVALFTGMRSGELYALKWTDLDFENRRITVSRSWCSKNGYGPTKNGRSRVVPMSAPLEKLLREIRIRSQPDAEFVLRHLRDWTNGEQARVTRDFCRFIGVTPVKFHDLRATFITQLLMKGVSLAQVMAIVGHSQIKTTNVYLRVAGCDLTGATDKLGFSLPEERLAQVVELAARL